jgi:hypothetical protein
VRLAIETLADIERGVGTKVQAQKMQDGETQVNLHQSL